MNKKRTLNDLNLLDDFLFQELISREETGGEFCRILLSTILGRPIGRVKVTPQKPILGIDTTFHGIRLDAYLEVMESEETDTGDDGISVEVDTDIYDIEPNQILEKGTLPRRTRFYQGLIDVKQLDTGASYCDLKRVVIIMITPCDPFGENRMVYTVKNRCVEEPDMPYDDGAEKIYLYTKGTKGNPSQELKEMLKYMENSVTENATNHQLTKIHQYVSQVKGDREVGIQYMKSWEYERMFREEGRAEGREEGRIEEMKTIILNMLKRGMQDDDICAIAGCTKEFVEDIRNSL